MTRTLAALTAAAFLACIIAANIVTTWLDMVWVFGLTATAGTYFAGATFVLRDTIQDALGKRVVVALIVTGAALSLALSPFFTDSTNLPPGVTATSIALASGAAFLCAELVDFTIYTPLRAHGYVRAAIASNIAGAIVDTILFLWISGFGVTGSIFAGQITGKLAVTAVVVVLVVGVRTRRAAREPVTV